MIILWSRGLTEETHAKRDRGPALMDIQEFLNMDRGVNGRVYYYEGLEDGRVKKRMAEKLGIQE